MRQPGTTCRFSSPISTRWKHMSMLSTYEWPFVGGTRRIRHVDGFDAFRQRVDKRGGNRHILCTLEGAMQRVIRIDVTMYDDARSMTTMSTSSITAISTKTSTKKTNTMNTKMTRTMIPLWKNLKGLGFDV